MKNSMQHAAEQSGQADVIGWLTENLKNTAEWRREKALEFPDDRRNIEAAEACERLSLLTDLSGDAANRYSASVESEDYSFSERQSEVLRGIGFHTDYETLDELADAIVPTEK